MPEILIHIKALIILLMETIYLIVAIVISSIVFGAVIGYLVAGYVYKKMFTIDIPEKEPMFSTV